MLVILRVFRVERRYYLLLFTLLSTMMVTTEDLNHLLTH